jgi:aminopeptidase N
MAARLIEPLSAWKRYAEPFRDNMRQALQRIVAHSGVSKNVLELAAKAATE